jgi:thiol-disulfide isomerase/thioredoxin
MIQIRRIESLLVLTLVVGVLYFVPQLRAGENGSAHEDADGAALVQAIASAKSPSAIADLGKKFDAFIADHPASSGLRELTNSYFRALRTRNPEAYIIAVTKYGLSSNPIVAGIAKRNQDEIESIKVKDAKAAAEDARYLEQLRATLRHGVDLKFTAFDGREIDTANLRGKVVLVDFWASWCGYCDEQIPYLVSAYHDYHDQGFEILGISFEEDLKEIKAPDSIKREQGKKRFLSYLQRHKMTWPQYYDGLRWENKVAGPFHVDYVPKSFLIDRTGQVVATNLRGPALAEALKKYLAQ